MISVTDLRNGTNIELDGQPWKVLEYKHIKMARGGATIKVKMRNILSGSTVEKSFNSGEKVQAADIAHYPAQFLYQEGEKYVFMDKSSFEQMSISKDVIGIGANFIQDNMDVEIEYYNKQPLGVTLPITVTLKVASTPDVSKGDTSGNVQKEAELETGYKTQVPAFIKEGDLVKIDTRTGAYIERA